MSEEKEVFKVEETQSEFGKGFIYNMILFAKHWAWASQWQKEHEKLRIGIDTFQMWFYAAGDHFFEFEIPEQFENTPIGVKAQLLKDLILRYRGSLFSVEITEKEFKKVFNLLEELAIDLDAFFGIDAEKATWE